MKAFADRDWDAYRSLVSEDFRYGDRGRRALLSGDVEMWIGSSQYNAAVPEFRGKTELIGTVGNRIALEHMVWTGGPGGNAYETTRVRLFEVDADGRVRALLLFDPDDRPAAFAEAQARFAAGEAAGVAAQAVVRGIYDEFARHDWTSMRERMAPDFVYQDHRTLGMGVLDRDAYLDSLRELINLAVDVQGEEMRTLAWNRHGRVVAYRTAGTFPDGGPFERVMVSLLLTDAERAVARFEALCAGESGPAGLGWNRVG